MKILKIFGIVVGIHVFALILIFANPGCSSTSKPTPAPSDTVAPPDSSATVSVPMTSPTTVPPGFNPDAPATSSSSSSYGGIRMTPLRPNTPAAGAVTTAPVTDVTPAQTYTVKTGDSLWELGKKFGVPYAEIAAANNLKSGSPLHAGQKLIIPGKKPGTATAGLAANGSAKAGAATTAKASAPPPPAASGGAMKHTIKLGETLSGIAKQYGVSTKDLGTANNISDPQKIRPGQELVIPGWNATGGANGKSAAKTPAAAKTPEPAKPVFSLDPNASGPAPAPASEPPVIPVEDNPLAPAPKSN